jgi:hypothetical protein
MRGDFDPYEAWLDIPSDRRPPTYYDLLAVPEDETDPQRIESAAAARMEPVRARALGEYGACANELLNEISLALICLTDPPRREQYDRERRRACLERWLEDGREPGDFYDLTDTARFAPDRTHLLAAIREAKEQVEGRAPADDARRARQAKCLAELEDGERALSDPTEFVRYHRAIVERLRNDYARQRDNAAARATAKELHEWLARRRIHPDRSDAVARCIRGSKSPDRLLKKLFPSDRRQGGKPGARRAPPVAAEAAPAIAAMDEDALLSLFERRGPDLFVDYADQTEALGRRVSALLDALADDPRRFARRLDFVAAGQHLLPTMLSRGVAMAWVECRVAIFEIDRLRHEKSPWGQTPIERIEEACLRLAQAAARAMPPSRLSDDRWGRRKQMRLRQIGHALLGHPPLYWRDAGLQQKITALFETGRWPEPPLRTLASERSSPSSWVAVIAAAAIVALAGAVVYVARSGQGTPTAAASAVDLADPSVDLTLETDQEAAPEVEPSRADSADVSNGPTGEASGAARAPLDEPAPAASAARSKAVDETLEAARQEADAAARDAAQVLARLADRQPPAPNVDREVEYRAWKGDAQAYARGRGGGLVDELALADGEAVIPAGVVSEPTPADRLRLGPGRLHLDSGTWEFGRGFDDPFPSREQMVPGLGRRLGLESVWVSLEARGDRLFLVVHANPETTPPIVREQMAKRAAALKRLDNSLQQKLRRFRLHGREIDGLIAILEEHGYEPPRSDSFGDPFVDEMLDEPADAWDRPSVEEAAGDLASWVARQRTQLEAEIDRGARQEQQAVAALKRSCRKITAVVYRLDE